MKLLLAVSLVLLPNVAAAQSRLQAYADSVDRAARTSALFEFQVDRPAKPLGQQPSPRYPEALRAVGVEGRVMARFEVDTAGVVDTVTFKVVNATHEAFGLAVREVLPQLRYQPAENKGRRVRQVVLQQFQFALQH
jgi:TonB family protein